MRTTGKLETQKVAYHRNGVGGAPFNVVLFTEDGKQKVGIVFNERAHVAVLDVELLTQGVIEFTQNSWRGDVYEGYLRQDIRAYHENR